MKKQIPFFFILFGCLVFNHAMAQVNYKWVKSISSSAPGDDKGYSIAVDDSGFVYVTGSFGGGIAPADFNPFGTPVQEPLIVFSQNIILMVIVFGQKLWMLLMHQAAL